MELEGTCLWLPHAIVRAQVVCMDRRSCTSLNSGKGSKLLELVDFILGDLDPTMAATGLFAILFQNREEQPGQAVPEAVQVWVSRAQAMGTACVVSTHLRQDGPAQDCSTKSVWQVRNRTQGV